MYRSRRKGPRGKIPQVGIQPWQLSIRSWSMGIRVVEPVPKPDIITGRGGGGYPIPVKPYQPKQNIVNRFTTLVKFFNAIILHKWIDLIKSYPFLAYGLPIIIHLVHDPSNHTDKNIQSVYYSVRGITRDTLNRTDLPT
ncbi:hypothetical protein OUZ56_029701 [Daphnia magna]|uniref:Uncharacterized protein n=1 Tax=Daphnia magna TaxID=35525 RepID=A0ABR0B7K5_9CRUS|nr:hypothetical protein OUZ56_029701 [Daphnia magna]